MDHKSLFDDERSQNMNGGGPLYLLFIGRGSLAPLEVETHTNLMLNYNSYSECTARTSLTGPIWVKSSRSHNSLIRTPNRMLYIWISIVSTRAMQW
jgi:hypothetical protein